MPAAYLMEPNTMYVGPPQNINLRSGQSIFDFLRNQLDSGQIMNESSRILDEQREEQKRRESIEEVEVVMSIDYLEKLTKSQRLIIATTNLST